MNPTEKIQDLESKNIRLKDQHNKDINLLSSTLQALIKADGIITRYKILTDKMQELNDGIMEDW